MLSSRVHDWFALLRDSAKTPSPTSVSSSYTPPASLPLIICCWSKVIPLRHFSGVREVAIQSDLQRECTVRALLTIWIRTIKGMKMPVNALIINHRKSLINSSFSVIRNQTVENLIFNHKKSNCWEYAFGLISKSCKALSYISKVCVLKTDPKRIIQVEMTSNGLNEIQIPAPYAKNFPHPTHRWFGPSLLVDDTHFKGALCELILKVLIILGIAVTLDDTCLSLAVLGAVWQEIQLYVGVRQLSILPHR